MSNGVAAPTKMRRLFSTMRLNVSKLVVLIVALAFPSFGTFAQSQSNFVTVSLPRGVDLQIPKSWWLLGEDYKQLIETSVEAVMDLSGLALVDNQEINLIAANSMPRSTYAAVRVDSIIPASITLSEFSSITRTDIRVFEAEIHRSLQLLLPQQGLELIEFIGSRRDVVSGYPSLVTEYRRSGPKGSVYVQSYYVFTENQDVRINLSYRESETVLWKPVIGKIRQSITIKRWP